MDKLKNMIPPSLIGEGFEEMSLMTDASIRPIIQAVEKKKQEYIDALNKVSSDNRKGACISNKYQ